MVRFLTERLGASHYSRQMMQFNEWIEELELVDLPLRGAKFTWTNNQDRRVCSKLDQFLFTKDWLDLYPRMVQEAWQKICSDHNPIILCQGVDLSLPHPFRFEIMWLEVPGFIDKIKSWWVDIQVEDMASFRFS